MSDNQRGRLKVSGVRVRCQAGVGSITYLSDVSSKLDFSKGYLYNFSHSQSREGYLDGKKGEEEKK